MTSRANEVWPDGMGKADWLYDREMDMHIPCCTRQVVTMQGTQQWVRGTRKCGNGPLTGEAILTGDCGEHGPLGPESDG
jgi:hypothetical protein